MSRAVLKPKKKKKPVLSEFVPKAYPNQKVQGGMGVLMPTQFNGGVATGDHSPVLEEKQEYVAPNVYAGYEDLTQEEFVELAKNPNPDVVNENYDFSGVQAAIEEYNKEPEVVPQASYNEERYNASPIEASLALAESAFEDDQEAVAVVNQENPVLETKGEKVGAEVSNDAVLTNKKEPAVVKDKGVLKASLTTTASEDRMSSPVSANARGSAMPDGKIGRNEMLMRMGARMMAGSTQGYGAAMDAAFTEMGAMQDSNRQAEMDAFNKAEATRLAEERIQVLRDKSNAKNAKTPNTAAMQYGMAALNAIDRIESLVNAEQKWVPWDNTTGLIGNLMKTVPASAANDVLQNIKTIEAAVGFDRLQAMRDASPTGGALGQVSNIELDLLKSSLGNLNQSQSKEQFMANLKQVQKVYHEIVHTDVHSPNSKNTVKPSGSNDSEYTDDEMKYLNS